MKLTRAQRKCLRGMLSGDRHSTALGRVPSSTLEMLRRLERAGLVDSRWQGCEFYIDGINSVAGRAARAALAKASP